MSTFERLVLLIAGGAGFVLSTTIAASEVITNPLNLGPLTTKSSLGDYLWPPEDPQIHPNTAIHNLAAQPFNLSHPAKLTELTLYLGGYTDWGGQSSGNIIFSFKPHCCSDPFEILDPSNWLSSAHITPTSSQLTTMTFHPDVVTDGFVIMPDVPEVYGANFITWGATNASDSVQILNTGMLLASPDGLRLLDGQSGTAGVAFVARLDPV